MSTPPTAGCLHEKKRGSTFCGPKVVPSSLNCSRCSHVYKCVFFAAHRWTCCSKIQQIARKAWRTFGMASVWMQNPCWLWDAFRRSHSCQSCPKKQCCQEGLFFNVPLPHRALRNSIATGLDQLHSHFMLHFDQGHQCCWNTGTCHILSQGAGHGFAWLPLLQRPLAPPGFWNAGSGWEWDFDLGNCHPFRSTCPTFGVWYFRSWGFVCQIQHLNSPWFVMELCYTFPKTWLVTKPSAFTLVSETFWWVVKRMFRGGQPQVGEMIKGAMRKKLTARGAGTGKGNVRTLSSSPSGRFSRQLWPDGQGRNHRKRHFGALYWRCPIGFVGFSRLMIRLIRLGENPAHGNITLPRRNAPSVLRSRSGIPMTMCRQNPKWSSMAREGKDYRWCNLDLMRFQGLEQVPRKTVAT